MILKTIVVDDEKPSRDALTKYINDFCNDVEVIATCSSVNEAYTAIIKLKPNLVFLDIEMPEKNGFDLLKMFDTIPFKVVFVTAYAEYAITALRFSASDYLLKPVLIDELVFAVNKVRTELSKEIGTMNLTKLIQNLDNSNQRFNQLVISDSNGFKVVNPDQIILCEADGYCTHFMLVDGDRVTSSKNLKHYEELLSGKHGFIRVHNSYMLNMAHIKSYSNQGEIRLAGNLCCPLGNAFKQRFLERFKHYR